MKVLASTLAVLAGLAAGQLAAQPLDTAFTYQGRLQDAGAPANGPYDFRFILLDAPVGGSQIGPIVTRDDIAVTDGLFTVSLDFGTSAFTGNKRWLDIAIRPGASGGAYTALSERQELQPAPHSAFSLRSPWAGIAGKPAGFADDTDNDALGGLTCANGQLAKWNGTAWACANDVDTTYSAGAGLDLTGTIFSLADLGVTTPKLANVAVSTPKLADSAVTSAKIADGSIATADLANGAVTSSIIADGAVALADLGQNGCGPNQILKWNGTAWACAADADTTYTAGAGLDLASSVFSVANLGITTPKLADSAVTAAKVADSAIVSAKIADGTIALADLGQNGCGPNQILKWNGTAWACAADLDTNSGGTVTSVGTGAGLTGGPITTGGTVAVATGGISTGLIADGAVTSPKIANGAVGLAQINTAEVQTRVGATCTVGQYLRGINPDGTVLCEPMPFVPNLITTIDDQVTNVVGSFTSIAIGADRLPIISYYDETQGVLKVAKCGNAACSRDNTLTFADPNLNRVGAYTSIAIPIDGLPIISYYDATIGALKVAKCGNAACSANNIIRWVDPHVNLVGLYTSIAIGADGLPIISYYDATAGDLKVAHCGNAACTFGNTTVIVDPVNNTGLYTSIAIGNDGLPVISYHDATAGDLKVIHCGNAACTAVDTPVILDSENSTGLYTSIAIGTDGFPVISYYNFTIGDLKVVHCGNIACTFGNTTKTVDDEPTAEAGLWSSIAIGTDGLPVISYQDFSTGALKVAHCGNAACTAENTLVRVDSGNLGEYTSIAIGNDGLPVISYRDQSVGALKVAKCATRTCQ